MAHENTRRTYSEERALNMNPHIDDVVELSYKAGSCPACYGEGRSLGVLGTFEILRCRDCGAEWRQ